MEGEIGTYRHAQEAGFRVLDVEILILKRLPPVDAGRACAIAVQEVTTLTHEILDLPTTVVVSQKPSPSAGHASGIDPELKSYGSQKE